MLDDLKEVIEKLQGVINTHLDYLEKKEARTRQVLIDPLLLALGWDVSNPNAVQIEYQVRTKWADYVLMWEQAGKPIAVVEAKRLGNSLEDDETAQAHIYANQAGIDYMIVTDGDRWKMFKAYGRGTLEDRQLIDFQLSKHLSEECVLQAARMWKEIVAPSDSKEARKRGPTDKNPVFPDPAPKPKKGKKPPTRLVVTMPNGEKIAYREASDTFVEVIRKIGKQRVKNLNKMHNNIPLISTSDNPKYTTSKLGKYFIITHSPTQTKKRYLEAIASALGVKLKVEIVPKG